MFFTISHVFFFGTPKRLPEVGDLLPEEMKCSLECGMFSQDV